MLNESEVRLLSTLSQTLAREPTLMELASHLGWSRSHTSRVVSGLEASNLVRSDRKGDEKTVSLADVQPVEEFETLASQYSHVDFADVIRGSTLRLLYYLDEPRTATELAELSGVSRATVYRRLDSLQRVGIVGKDRSRYALTDGFTPLAQFARSLAHHEHRREAKAVASDVYILWEDLDEYLFGCRSELTDERFHRTGPAVFDDYGIALLTRKRTHYLRSERLTEVTPAELVCHTLLIHDGTRYRSYCLLLIAGRGIDKETLEERATRYDRTGEGELREIVESLYAYLETEGEASGGSLPTWREFETMAAEYEIDV